MSAEIIDMPIPAEQEISTGAPLPFSTGTSDPPGRGAC